MSRTSNDLGASMSIQKFVFLWWKSSSLFSHFNRKKAETQRNIDGRKENGHAQHQIPIEAERQLEQNAKIIVMFQKHWGIQCMSKQTLISPFFCAAKNDYAMEKKCLQRFPRSTYRTSTVCSYRLTKFRSVSFSLHTRRKTAFSCYSFLSSETHHKNVFKLMKLKCWCSKFSISKMLSELGVLMCL